MSFSNALLPGRLTFPRGPDFVFLLSRSSELFIATTIFFSFFLVTILWSVFLKPKVRSSPETAFTSGRSTNPCGF